jgi:hypothetical protein
MAACDFFCTVVRNVGACRHHANHVQANDKHRPRQFFHVIAIHDGNGKTDDKYRPRQFFHVIPIHDDETNHGDDGKTDHGDNDETDGADYCQAKYHEARPDHHGFLGEKDIQ